ncbi:MAG: hypothetical protein AAF721_00415 [Myxococcota bacterium]
MLGRLYLPISVKLQAALCLVGETAKALGPRGLAIKADADAVAQKVGPETKVLLQVPAAMLFARACDTMREQGADATVALLEELIATIKSGENRQIVATLNLGHANSVAELDDSLELARKVALRNAGG